MDQKPLVTYAGDQSVFSSIEPGLVSGLITEAVEWKRSYGRYTIKLLLFHVFILISLLHRTSRQVYVECEFQQWNMENVSSGSSVTNIQVNSCTRSGH